MARTTCGRTTSAHSYTTYFRILCKRSSGRVFRHRAVNDFHASLALKCYAFWLRFCLYFFFIAAWSSPDCLTWACPVVLLPPLKVSLIYSLQNDPKQRQLLLLLFVTHTLEMNWDRWLQLFPRRMISVF